MGDLVKTLRRVLSGDRDAYSEIVAEHQDMLLAYAAFRLPDAALVDEVVQQTFIRAFEQLRDFQTDKDFGVWLRSICRFMILAELKRATRDRQNKDNYQELMKVDEIASRLGQSATWVATTLFRVRETLRKCIGDGPQGIPSVAGPRSAEEGA